MLIQNAKAFMDGKFQEKTDLLIRDGRISAIGTGLAAEGEETLDLGGDLLLPGFVDVHIHAFKGMDTMQGEEAVRHMSPGTEKGRRGSVPAYHHERQPGGYGQGP